MSDEQEFESMSDDFLYELFKLALNKKDILDIVLSNLKINYLPEKNWKDIFSEIKTQYTVENKIPTIGTLQLAFRNNRDILFILKEIKGVDLPEADSILLAFENYIKQVRFVELYDDCGESYNRGKRKEAFNKFIKGSEELSKFDLLNEKFETVFHDFDKRQVDRLSNTKQTEKIPFGIDELDMVTNGGPETTEFVLFLGDAKSGKSFLLSHIGMNAARRGHAVAHFQLEGTKKQCLDRYDSAWSGVLYHDIKKGDFPSHKYDSYKKIISNLGKTDIFVEAPEKFLATTMVEIQQKVIRLKKEHNIKVVIIDYLDLVIPNNNTIFGAKDEKFKQQMVSRMMKDLAVEQNVLVCSATQASSISKELLDDPDFVIKREHLAEDKGKVRPVDMLITLNQTKDEKKDRIMRLYTEALREYAGDDIIIIKQNLKYSRFYDRKATLSAFELDLPSKH